MNERELRILTAAIVYSGGGVAPSQSIERADDLIGACVQKDELPNSGDASNSDYKLVVRILMSICAASPGCWNTEPHAPSFGITRITFYPYGEQVKRSISFHFNSRGGLIEIHC